jgi:hypothetical protein
MLLVVPTAEYPRLTEHLIAILAAIPRQKGVFATFLRIAKSEQHMTALLSQPR